MSGLEVVGLLLGAIPLFISAAEHYRNGLGFIKRAVRKQAFVARYRDELVEQRTLLLLYLKAVIGRTDLAPSVQAALIENPHGKAWQNPPVIRALTKELGDAYQPFVNALTTICTILAKQIRTDDASSLATPGDEDLLQRLQSLCLESADEKSADREGASHLWDKVKFSWKHPQRMAMLEELRNHTKSLNRLASAANRAKPYERKQQYRRVHTTYELRNDTERLYQALCRACSCPSPKERTIGLGLAVHHKQSDESGTDSRFEIVVFDEQNNGWTVAVRLVRGSDDATQQPPKKKIRIDVAQFSRRPMNSVDGMKRLHDICKEHQLARKSDCCLQLILNEKNELYSDNSKVTSRCRQQLQPQPPVVDPALSLNEVMTNLKLYDRKRWVHREKAILAVILAYSLPQIHQSSWWQSLLNSESISFLGLPPLNFATTRNPDQHVKLRRPFTKSVIAEGGDGSSPCPPHTNSRKNAHLHALGIVLLELFLNRSIKDEVDANGGGSDYRGVAQDLLDEHADDINMTTEYLRAIRFCLSPHPNPYSRSFSFEDQGFREIFYTEVISMLEDHLSSRFEVSDDLWVQDSE